MNIKCYKKIVKKGGGSSTIHYSLLTINSPRAFTLVELLTVIVIISMLAAISLVALNGAYTEAKIAKTRGTIAKLDAAILQIFEEFEDRLEAIRAQADEGLPASASNTDKERRRLHFIWDTMRMEMPTHWAEVRTNGGERVEPIPPPVGSTAAAKEPAVFDYYYRVCPTGNRGNGSAELLYLIIANLNPEALENFHGSEIGIGSDGLSRFIDAWGNPIRFMRAAPGFTGTDKQPDVVARANLALNAAGNNAGLWTPAPSGISDDDWENLNIDVLQLSNAFRWATVREGPDPFNENGEFNRSWFLYPVVVSAGPDGEFSTLLGRGGLNSLASPANAADLNPFNYPVGIPEADSGSRALYHYDNIHNHRSAGGF